MNELRIITDCNVYVLARQSIDHTELTRFLNDTGFPNWGTDSPCDGESVVEIAARLCYRSFRGGRPHDEHVKHLLEVGHGSCAEHAVWTLLITGVSRTLTHELVRHRIGISPSQESQRYVDASEVAFVVPPLLLGGDDLSEWKRHCRECLAEYEALYRRCLLKIVRTAYSQDNVKTVAEAEAWVKRHRDVSTPFVKQARETARSVLPGCAETRIALTGNARAWRNFVELRCSRHADAEIRRLACRVLTVMQAEAPNLFGDYRRMPLPDGSFEVTTPYRKV